MTLTKIIAVFLFLKVKEFWQWGWNFFIEKICKDFLWDTLGPLFVVFGIFTVAGCALWGVVALFDPELVRAAVASIAETNEFGFISNFMCMGLMTGFPVAVAIAIVLVIINETSENWRKVRNFFVSNWKQSKVIVLNKNDK